MISTLSIPGQNKIKAGTTYPDCREAAFILMHEANAASNNSCGLNPFPGPPLKIGASESNFNCHLLKHNEKRYLYF